MLSLLSRGSRESDIINNSTISVFHMQFSYDLRHSSPGDTTKVIAQN